MDFLPVSANIALLRLYSLAIDTLSVSYKVTTKLVCALRSAFKARTYYFMVGYTTPLPANNVDVFAPSSAEVDFIYDADKKEFSMQHAPARYLPILSFEIVRDGKVIYDLTDFISDIKIVSSAFPSVSQVLNAWAIDSHVVLSKKYELVARLISANGNTFEVSVNDTKDMSVAMANLEPSS
jgi:hypothetical protein